MAAKPTDKEPGGSELDSASLEELQDFLDAGPEDAAIDVTFKNRLREELWGVLRKHLGDRPDSTSK